MDMYQWLKCPVCGENTRVRLIECIKVSPDKTIEIIDNLVFL